VFIFLLNNSHSSVFVLN